MLEPDPGASVAGPAAPVDVSVPSWCRVKQRPPLRGSTTTSAIDAEPMWCAGGHQLVVSSVSRAKARAATTISRRMGSSVSVIGSPVGCGRRRVGSGTGLEGGQRALPECVQVGGQHRETRRAPGRPL